MRLRSLFNTIRRAAWLAGWMTVCSAAINPVAAHPELLSQIEQLDIEITAQPGDAGLLVRRGELYRREGDFTAAAQDFKAARELQPEFPDLDLYAGRLALETGDAAGAEQLLGAYLGRQPGNASAWKLRGNARLMLQQPLKAAQDYGQAIENSKSPTPTLYMQQAKALQSAGPEHANEALQVIDQGLARFPREISLLGLGMDISLERGALQKARGYFSVVPQPVRQLPQWQARQATLENEGGS